MSTEITASTTVELVELSRLDPAAIRLEESTYAGERILHLAPEVRAYLQTLGSATDLAAVETLIGALCEVRAEMVTARRRAGAAR